MDTDEHKILSAFVPSLVGDSIERNLSQLGLPFTEEVTAAVLFADLSGFTEISERYSQNHSRGAEDVQRVLNVHFSRLLDVIARWEGSTLKFAGDAIIAFWVVEDAAGLSRATRLATSAGLEIQQTPDCLNEEEDFPLRQRLVVGAGLLQLHHIGGIANKWEFVASGEIWRQVSLAESNSSIGDVVLSEQAKNLVLDYIRGEEVNDHCFKVSDCLSDQPTFNPHEVSEQLYSAEMVAPYVSESTKTQMLGGHKDWMAEFRTAFILFLKIDNFNVGSSSQVVDLQDVACTIQGVLNRNDGHIVQFMIDDKGLILLAAWGLALGSHENDAERAVLSALQLSDELAKIGVKTSCGIKSGKVFSGLLGNDQHLEYAVVGDTVNTAARLMQASKGGILCDKQIFDATLHRFNFREIGEISMKGKDQALTCYQPLDEHSLRITTRGDLVGRKKEVGTIDRALEKIVAGEQIELMHIEGEPGLGKSAIAEHLLDKMRSMGLDFCVGIADSLRRSDAYFAWEPIFAHLLEIDAGSTHEEILDSLSAIPNHSDLAPLLNLLLPIAFPESELTKTLDVFGRAEYTRDFLIQVIVTKTEKLNTVLVFDDVHWFDSASWLFLESLKRQAPQIPIIIFSRPLSNIELPIEIRRYLDTTQVEVIRLSSMPFEECRQLISARLNVSSVSEDLARRIYEKTEGHPLFTEELVFALEHHSAILRIDQSAMFAHADEDEGSFAFPDALEGTIAGRIDRLDMSEQLTLKVASVIGREFDLHSIAAIRPLTSAERDLEEQLQKICSVNLVERVPSEDNTRFRFRHAIIRDTAHNLLVSEQQRLLHEAAAQWYENRYAENLAPYHSLLAHHWGLANVDERAIHYLELAAIRARDENANIEVVKFLSEARERSQKVAMPKRRLAEWDHLLGMAEVNLGLFVRAEQHLKSSVSMFLGKQPSSKASAILGVAYELLVHTFYRIFNRKHSFALDREMMLAAADCYAVLSRIYYNNHDLELTIHSTLAGTNLAMRAGGDSSVLARLYSNMAIAAVTAPGGQAEYYGNQSLSMSNRLNDPATQTQVLMIVATYEMSVAKWNDAIHHYKESMEIAQSIGEKTFYEMSLGSLGNIYRLRGTFQLADEADHQLLNCGFDRSVTQVQVWGLYGRVCALSNLNKYRELADVIAAFGQLLKEPGVREEVSASNVVAYLTNLALLRISEGDSESALPLIEEAVMLVDELKNLQVYMVCTISYLQDSIMALQRHRPEDSRISVWLKKTSRFASRCAAGYPIALPRKLLGKGYRALLSEQGTEAVEHWQAAAKHAKQLDIPFDEAQAYFNLSRSQSVSSLDREEAAEHSKRILSELNIEIPQAWLL